MVLVTTYRQPSRLLLPLILGGVASPFLLLPASMLEKSSPGLANGIGIAGIAGMLGCFIGMLVAARARPRTGRVQVGPDGVRLDDRLLPRAEIGGGVFVPATEHKRAYVELRTKKDSALAHIDVTGDVQGKEVLRALGLGASDVVARFGCMTPPDSATTRLSLGLVLFGALLVAGMFALHAPWLLVITMLSWISASLLRPATFHIGADGIRIKGRVEDRFVPWGEVASVEPYAKGVLVKRHDGTTLRIPVTVNWVVYGWEKEAIGAMVERCREALAPYRAGTPVHAEAWLLRRGRSLDEWRRALFADREATFRENALRDDDLWKILEDPSAKAGARGAAAAMLTSGADDTTRSRIRIAADACADQRLRVALDRAATGAEEEELAQALDEIEDEATMRATRAS